MESSGICDPRGLGGGGGGCCVRMTCLSGVLLMDANLDDRQGGGRSRGRCAQAERQ